MSGKSKTSLMIAMGVGLPIALNSEGEPPAEIMVLPAGDNGVLQTVDGRGPYRIGDAAALASRSLAALGGEFPIDETHSTDLAAPNGQPAPARGWATALQARADGIWAKIDWNASGAALLKDRAYRFISPVFTHDKAGNITGLLRASLTNTPNLRGMAALHAQETNMDLLAQLRTLLGLADDADAETVVAKIRSLTDTSQTATAAALKPIATAAGLKDDADATAIATAVTALATAAKTGDGTTITALQAELTKVTTQLSALTETTARDKATAFVDGAIKEGRIGVKPMREHYIARHMTDPASVEKEIGAMAKPTGRILDPTPPKKDGAVDMEDPVALAAAATKYRADQAALGVSITIADAVVALKERAS